MTVNVMPFYVDQNIVNFGNYIMIDWEKYVNAGHFHVSSSV